MNSVPEMLTLILRKNTPEQLAAFSSNSKDTVLLHLCHSPQGFRQQFKSQHEYSFLLEPSLSTETAFRTEYGLYQTLLMNFGLCGISFDIAKPYQ